MPGKRVRHTAGQVGGTSGQNCESLLALTGAGVFETDASGLITHADDRYCELLGRTRDELVGRLSLSDLIVAEDRGKISDFTDTSMRKDEAFSAEVRYRCPDDSVIWGAVFAERIGEALDPSRGLHAVVVDITKRKRAEHSLRSSEARLSAIFAHAPVALCELSLDGRLERVNDELCRLLGRSREALLGMNVAEVTHAEDVSHTQSALTQLLETGVPASLEKRYLRRDGEIVFARSSISRLDDEQGRPEVILAVTVDLTERHRMELALLKSEERYRTLFDSIDEGFCVMEVIFDESENPIDYRFLQVNPAFAKQAGLSNVIAKRPRDLGLDLEQFWFDTFGRIAVTGESRRFANEVRQWGRWFDVYAFRIDKPEARHVAAVFNDITDRVREKAELKQTDRRKNEFMAVLAHELRNPLAPIRSGLQILRMSRGERGSNERILELMERQLQQLVRLVDDLLDLSRINQAKVRIQSARTSLQEVIDNSVEGSRPLIDSSGVSLHISTPDDPVVLEADSARLAQILSNLLSNAAKYTDAGGKVWLTAEASGEDAVFKVRDTGTGIPADMLNTIFEAFTQVGSSLARSHGGLGIGLSLVKTLVELHGGTVSAHSEGPGKGSEFVVRLPGIVKTKVTETTSAAKTDDALGSHRVLVVDDNADAADSLAMMLRMLGNDVAVAHSGQEGLSLTEQFHPELLLLDLGMPELDGYEVARRIRSQPWGRSIIVAALTGWGQEEDRRRSRQAGFDHHLVKPVDLGALRDMLGHL